MPNAKDKPLDIKRTDSRKRSIERALDAEKASPKVREIVGGLREELSEIHLKLRDYENAKSIDPRRVRSTILGLAEHAADPPQWLLNGGSASSKSPGIPVLFASDWHWGEVVRKSEIGGVNEFGLSVAHKRAKLLIERTIDLLFNHMVNPTYPGIVFVFGGDMVSGDIHEELKETNELPSLPTLLNLLDILTWAIDTLADKFGRVFIPAVAGNHGRQSRKPRFKFRAQTNYDWLLYSLLEKHFKGDKRIAFLIPDGPDALFSVHNTTFLLTHGDQFRGGDGMIGALGPIIRGDHRKRTRASQIHQDYDVMILGHWHQYIHLERLIVNGSLKGYDEYANGNGFGFEVAQQALWLVHPKHGITFRIPVILQDTPRKSKGDWVSAFRK